MNRFGLPPRAGLKTRDGQETFSPSRSNSTGLPATAQLHWSEDDKRAQWVTTHLAKLAAEAQTPAARAEWKEKCAAIAVENPPLAELIAERKRLRHIHNLDGETWRGWDQQSPGLSERYLDTIISCRERKIIIWGGGSEMPNTNSPSNSPTSASFEDFGARIDQIVEQEKQAEDNKLFTELFAKYEAAVRTSKELNAAEIIPRQKIFGEFLCEGDLGFIYGLRGSGKSWLVDAIATHVSTGHDLASWASPNGAWPVLYVDGEMPEDLTRDRVCRLNQPNDNLFVLHHERLFDVAGLSMNFTNELTQKIITELCLKKKVKLLILDNLSCLFGGLKENDADDWGRVLLWLLDLRRRRIAVIIVHHAGRNGFMRGTSKREDPAAWSIKVTELDMEPGQKGARFETIFDKQTRNSQDREWTRRWHFKTENSGIISISCEEISLDGKVLRLLQDGLRTVKEIAEELGQAKSTIHRALNRLVKAKVAERRGGYRGTYEPRGAMKE